LPHTEFAYNKAPSKVTGLSPFNVVCGIDPLNPLVFTPSTLDREPSAIASLRVEKI